MTHTLRLPVFVYGTLRTGQGNWRGILAGNTQHEETATLTGVRMHDYGGGFPFVTRVGAAQTDTVVGDLMTIPEATYDHVLGRLDGLEGYRGPGMHNMYDRVQVTVTTADGIPVTAWTYLASESSYQRTVCTLPIIESGDWVTHLNQRTSRHAGLGW